MRTSILDVLSGPVCDATLGCNGSGAVLRDLARANMLLVPLDQSDVEYRYHPLFAEMLSAELRRGEPELEPRAPAAGRRLVRGARRPRSRGRITPSRRATPPPPGSLLWASAAPHVLCGRTAPVRSLARAVQRRRHRRGPRASR